MRIGKHIIGLLFIGMVCSSCRKVNNTSGDPGETATDMLHSSERETDSRETSDPGGKDTAVESTETAPGTDDAEPLSSDGVDFNDSESALPLESDFHIDSETETEPPSDMNTDDPATVDTDSAVDTDSNGDIGDSDVGTETAPENETESNTAPMDDTETEIEAPKDTCLDLEIKFDGVYPEEITIEKSVSLDATCTLNGSPVFVTRHVDWTVDDTALATIGTAGDNDGWLVPKKRGRIRVTASYSNPDGAVVTDEVEVELALPNIDIQIAAETTELYINQVIQLSAMCDDLDDDEPAVDCTEDAIWQSTDTRIVFVYTDHKARAQQQIGSAVIRASMGATYAELELTVVPVTGIRIAPEEMTLFRNSTASVMSAYCMTESGEEFPCTEEVFWDTSSHDVVDVSLGHIQINGEGTADIYATLDDVYSSLSHVTVTPVDCSDILLFPHANLESHVRSAIGKPTGDIYAEDVAGLTAITSDDDQLNAITNISGIECLTDLTTLHIHQLEPGEKAGYEILDITPLAALTHLEHLYLVGNGTQDLTPLSGLTALTTLDLSNNRITDLTVLGSLTQLLEVNLSDNIIDDLVPLIENEGIDAGDRLIIEKNPLGCDRETTQSAIETLQERGVTVTSDCD